MKHIITTSIVALAISSANAFDFTAGYSRDTTHDANGVSFAIGKRINNIGFSASIERYEKNNSTTDNLGVSASYEVLRVFNTSISPTLGLSYVSPELGKGGFATVVGIGLESPIAKRLSVVTEITRTLGEDKIKSLDATNVSLGIRTSF